MPRFDILRDVGVPFGMPPSKEQMDAYCERLQRETHRHRMPLSFKPMVPGYRRSSQGSVPREVIRREVFHKSDDVHLRTRHAKPAHLHRYHTGESHPVVTNRRNRAVRSSGREYPRSTAVTLGHSGPTRPGDVMYVQTFINDVAYMIWAHLQS
jgi:hypothetical protein